MSKYKIQQASNVQSWNHKNSVVWKKWTKSDTVQEKMCNFHSFLLNDKQWLFYFLKKQKDRGWRLFEMLWKAINTKRVHMTLIWQSWHQLGRLKSTLQNQKITENSMSLLTIVACKWTLFLLIYQLTRSIEHLIWCHMMNQLIKNHSYLIYD